MAGSSRAEGLARWPLEGGCSSEKASPPRHQRQRPRRLTRLACRPGSGGLCASARAPSDEEISEVRAWTHGCAGRSAVGACVQEQGTVRVRARAGTPRGAIRRGLMPWKSAAISTEVSESMGDGRGLHPAAQGCAGPSEGAACVHHLRIWRPRCDASAPGHISR
jgi:hypothetical protein